MYKERLIDAHTAGIRGLIKFPKDKRLLDNYLFEITTLAKIEALDRINENLHIIADLLILNQSKRKE